MKEETIKAIKEKYTEAIKTDLSNKFKGSLFKECDADPAYPKAYHIYNIPDKIYNILLSREPEIINSWNDYHKTEYTSTREAVESPTTSESEMWLYLYALIDKDGACVNVGVDINGELPDEFKSSYLLPVSDKERDAISSRFKELESKKKEKYEKEI